MKAVPTPCPGPAPRRSRPQNRAGSGPCRPPRPGGSAASHPRRNTVPNIQRRPHPAQNGPAQAHGQRRQHNRKRSAQQNRRGGGPLDAFGTARTVPLAQQNRKAAGHALHEAKDKVDDNACGPHRSQGARTDGTAHNHRIRQAVYLLKEISENHRRRKRCDPAPGTARG